MGGGCFGFEESQRMLSAAAHCGSARGPACRAAEWVAAPERVTAEAWHSSSDACHAARSACLNPDCAAAAAAASVLRLEWVLLLGAGGRNAGQSWLAGAGGNAVGLEQVTPTPLCVLLGAR